MKQLLETILALFSKADVIVIDGGPLLSSVEVEEIEGNPINQIVRASWNIEGLTYEAIFTEEGLSGGYWKDGMFYAEDHEGDETEICFFSLQKLSPHSESVPAEEAIHTDILQHRIEWFLNGNDTPGELDSCSVEHIEKCIKEGYGSGELCVLGSDGNTEYRGWWKIATK